MPSRIIPASSSATQVRLGRNVRDTRLASHHPNLGIPNRATVPRTDPGSAFCWPGEAGCYSYDAPAWANQSPPIHITDVTFADGSHPSSWAVVSDYGGNAEITDPTETGSACRACGGPLCIYPWFTRNRDGSFGYGVDYPTTLTDYGKADQFARTEQCGGPFGHDSTYCATVIH